ncbi:MAG: hypothetical protein ACJAZT_001965 [Gammaproteobacteria bacterium]|jgi:hypothetical protein
MMMNGFYSNRLIWGGVRFSRLDACSHPLLGIETVNKANPPNGGNSQPKGDLVCSEIFKLSKKTVDRFLYSTLSKSKKSVRER